MSIEIQHPLYTKGVDRLNLIGKHRELLMHVYLKGNLDETSVIETVLTTLLKSKILYRADATTALSLHPNISNFIAILVEDERKRQINADIAGRLEQITTLVNHYKDAIYRNNTLASEQYFLFLTEKVHGMIIEFKNAISNMWNNINSNFAFVTTLNEKIRENNLAQQQIKRLLDGFELIDFDEMILISSNVPSLYKLLVSGLQSSIDKQSNSLLAVQKRLTELMVKFRQQQKRIQLLNNMANFLLQNPHFEVADYANRTKVVDIINKATPININASIALDRLSDRQFLSDIIRDLKLKTNNACKPLEYGSEFELVEIPVIDAKHPQLKKDVEEFFINLIDNGNITVSALAYLHNSTHGWDSEIWLFQVIAEYESLDVKSQQSFSCVKKKHFVSIFNQLEIIQDVHIREFI